MSTNYVLYHTGCRDGFAAALAAWLVLQEEATYIPVQYQEAPPRMEANSTVYILDFSYPLDILKELSSLHEKVLVLDHHATAQQDLLTYKDSIFDLTKSGAVIAWEYFHPKEPLPLLFQYVQDRDLWKWELTETEAVNEVLQHLGYKNFNLWLPYLDKKNIPQLLERGALLIEVKNRQIETLARNSYIGTLAEVPCAFCNASIYQSELAHVLMDTHQTDLAAIWYRNNSGKVIYSLRSRNDIDCSAIAKGFGGGGHKFSAGMSFYSMF